VEKVEKRQSKMEKHVYRNMKLAFVLVVLIAVALCTAVWALSTFYQPFNPLRPLPPPPESNPGDLQLFYAVNAVVSSVNIALLVFLLITNVDIFRKTRSKFTFGLLIFSVAFLFKDLTSSPVVVWAFGFRAAGLGPFALLPALFEFVVLVVLLYLSFE
jgi:hypothetical protein